MDLFDEQTCITEAVGLSLQESLSELKNDGAAKDRKVVIKNLQAAISGLSFQKGFVRLGKKSFSKEFYDQYYKELGNENIDVASEIIKISEPVVENALQEVKTGNNKDNDNLVALYNYSGAVVLTAGLGKEQKGEAVKGLNRPLVREVFTTLRNLSK